MCAGQKRQLEVDVETAAGVAEKKVRREDENDISINVLSQLVVTEPSKTVGPDVSHQEKVRPY